MINYDSILSAFDGKPTLLQWLKMVKKALDESILKNVNIAQNGEKVVFTFNFEDGTSISTPEVTIPKGDKGNDGVSITGINYVSDRVVGDRTLTTLRANYSNNTSDEFEVTAKNGKDAAVKIYTHLIYIRDSSFTYNIYFKVFSSKENLTLEDALAQIPTANGAPGNIYNKPKIPVCYNYGSYYGVLSATKYVNEGNYTIEIGGVVDTGNSVERHTKTISNPVLGSDTLLE